ncbi:MAG: tRNA (adenosine(37)-N6)-threonylcarbamoyltransferase complex dimerization subunit type 1 TsaB [Alphaproteobacteria bacterium]|nr:tRNA (adenosine(37)-N6)-threonylcarbamoyltransferase complex dimerization subunit type 1 TsaB [Alphaproteobacteria bacterium]
MHTLSFDTTANSVSIALLRDDVVLTKIQKDMVRGQGEALIPMIQDLCVRENFPIANINRIAVSIGPGSFTGVRVGLAAARGMGLALNIPVYGVTTLQALAYKTTGLVLAVLDTKRGDYYTQLFRDGTPMEQPSVRSLTDICALTDISLAGPDAVAISAQTKQPIADNHLLMAEAVGLFSLVQACPPEPLYLREADVHC